MVGRLWGLAASWVTWQTLLVGVAVFLAVIYLTRKRYRLPPGPTPLPLLGNTLSFRNCKMNEKLYEWSKTYGPVITIYLGPVPCVVLQGLEAVTEALVKKAGDFAGRPYSFTMHKMTEGGKDIAIADYGPVWKIHRRLGLKALKKYMSGTALEQRAEDALRTVCALIEQKQGPFETLPVTSFLVNSLLCGVIFGKNYGIEDPDFQMILDVFKVFSDNFGKGFWEDVLPPLRLLPTQRFRNIMAANQRLFQYLCDNIEQHRQSFNPEHVRDVTDALLLEMRQDAEFQQLSGQAYLRQSIRDLYVAGLDTSRQTLHFALFHMASFPAVQAKVQAELDSVLGSRRWPRLEDKARLSYTEATLQESMRLGPVVPLGLFHQTTTHTSLGEYEIPRGTMVAINHWALLQSEEYWDCPRDFRPERFLSQDGKMASKPAAWLPFSAGRRVCLGETVARPELLLLLAGLLKNFSFRFPEGEAPDVHAVEGSGLVLQPPPFHVLASRRT